MTHRRGHNEGTISKRPDGLWQARVSLGYRIDPKGEPQRVRKSVYGKTRKEVVEKMDALRRGHEQGLPVDLKRQTVAQYLTQWLEDSVKPTVRPRTHVSYSQLVQKHIIPALGTLQLAKLAPQHVQKMMKDLAAKGLSPRTIQYVRAVLRRALGQGEKFGLIPRNVATLVDPPRSVHRDNVYLDDRQASAFLNAVEGDPFEALYAVSLWLGLRQGEALGLRWDDIDFDNLTLTVRYQVQRIGGKLTLTEPKTKKSRRTVPLPKRVAVKLREHRLRQLEARLTAGEKWDGSWNLVFTTSIGTPLDARNVIRPFKAILAKAGLPDMRWHDLRHSSATLQLAYGATTREIMETLGHSQETMTNLYAHVVPELQRRTMDRMDERFGT